MTKTQIEVITSVERRRRWSRAEKERVVAAAMEPGAVASAVAREAGIHASQLYRWQQEMDDFGTGYSSLGYLQKFPFDKIKIDRSFVHNMTEREDSLAIVRAVAAMGTSLGMMTTAEGVETAEQFDRLKSEGCTEVQG